MNVTRATELHGATPFTVPKSKFNVGDMVTWNTSHTLYEENFEYYLKCYLWHLIKSHRSVLGRLQAEGYMTTATGRLSPKFKDDLRALMSVIRNAKVAYVVGVQARGMHACDSTVYHESYINGIPGASSGIYFEYQLCFRWSVDGQQLSMFTSVPIVRDDMLVLVPKRTKKPRKTKPQPPQEECKQVRRFFVDDGSGAVIDYTGYLLEYVCDDPHTEDSVVLLQPHNLGTLTIDRKYVTELTR